MALTRDVVGTITRVYGKPWIQGTVTAQLVSAFATIDDTHPKDTADTVTDDSGDFTLTLAFPETGTAAYLFTLPGGEQFAAHIPYDDGSDIDFETLVMGAYEVPTDIDTTLALILARLAPPPQTLTDGATITWDFGGYPFRNARVTLGGDRQLAITNLPAGVTADGRLEIIQGTGGGHSLALPTGADNYVIEDGQGVITLSSAEGAIDVITFYWDGTKYLWTYGTNFTKAP